MAILQLKSSNLEIARSIHRDIKNGNDYYHIVLGKTTPWDDEEQPEDAIDSVDYENTFRRNVLTSQLIGNEDICHLIRRIDWQINTVYDPYDSNYSIDNPAYSDAVTLANANFYVMTDEYKVYKCLDNNDNSPSTVKPTGTATYTETLSDGYVWKFMFQISASDQTNFLDSLYIPVRKVSGNPTHDVNGELDSITVTNGGSGYTGDPTIIINGDGTGAYATATLDGDAIGSINITSVGSGYTFAYVTIVGTGTGAEATVQLGDADTLPALQLAVESTVVKGTVDRIKMVTQGQDYVQNDVSVSITGDGTGAEASPVIDPGTGAITGVNVTNPGSGYTFANVTFNQTDGIGTNATARVIISPIQGHGSNPVKELFSDKIGIVATLNDVNNPDLFLNNDFRQVGMVKNLSPWGDDSSVYTEQTGTSCFIMNVNDDSFYNEDDIITTNDSGKFTVVQTIDKNDGTFDIHLLPEIPNISGLSEITNESTGTSGLSINSVTNPEIDIKTGTVLYIENRQRITRQSLQVETIKAILQF